MSAHVRTCAHCGTGPAAGPAAGSCCWNPIGCGCDVLAPSGEPTSVLLAVTRSELATARQALAASQADLTRVEREREVLRIQLAGVLQFTLAWQGQEAPCPHGQPGGKACGPCSFDRAIPPTPPPATATAELEQLRAAQANTDRHSTQQTETPHA